MMSKFEHGQLVATKGVIDKMSENMKFAMFVNDSFERYTQCDWGDTCEEDQKSNDHAVEHGERILAVYKKSFTEISGETCLGDVCEFNMEETEWTIWIITEWDRSVTTVLFPEEY